MKVFPGTVPICANILKEGNLLAISPGGVYEAQFGNSNYELLWRNRYGFAKVAVEAQAVSTNLLCITFPSRQILNSRRFRCSLSFQCLRKTCVKPSDRLDSCVAGS